MTFCDKPAGIEVSLWTDGGGQTEGQTDVEVEIVVSFLEKDTFAHIS